MQRAIMRFEQGATGLAGLAALLPRRNATQTHNCLCPKDLCRRGATNINIIDFEIGSTKNKDA